MNTPRRIVLAILAATLGPPAFARPVLVDSFPAKGQVLAGSPTQIRLAFSEHVQARRCRIKLRSDAGKNFDADRPAADKTRPDAIVAAVPVLRPGTYRAVWTAVDGDGHKTHGDFSFTVSK